MTKQMVLLPTWDGQSKGTAAIDPMSIDMIRPGVMPGMTNIYFQGDYINNVLGVYMEFKPLLELLTQGGLTFLDLGGGTTTSKSRDSGE